MRDGKPVLAKDGKLVWDELVHGRSLPSAWGGKLVWVWGRGTFLVDVAYKDPVCREPVHMEDCMGQDGAGSQTFFVVTGEIWSVLQGLYG